MSRAFIKMAGMDLLGNERVVFVSNSQEQLRLLEMLRSLAMTNNTSGATPVDLASIITSNSPQEIKIQLAQSFKKSQEREDRKLQIQQEQVKQQSEQFQLEQELETARLDKELESKERVAQIMADGRQRDNNNVSSTEPDPLELDKASTNKQSIQSKMDLERDKHIANLEQQVHQRRLDIDKLALEQKKIEAGIVIENKKIEFAKIMKGQKDSDSKKKK